MKSIGRLTWVDVDGPGLPCGSSHASDSVGDDDSASTRGHAVGLPRGGGGHVGPDTATTATAGSGGRERLC